MLQFTELNDFPAQRAGHIVPSSGNDTYYIENTIVAAKYEVNIIRIAQYINEVVATRKIPPGRKSAVVMKLDVEV